MKLASALVLISLMHATAEAATPASCSFVSREERKTLLTHLPKEVIGFADCAASHPELRGLMLAQFKRLDQATLENFMNAYARVAVADGRRTYTVKQMTGQAVLETLRPGGSQPVWHYTFTSRAKNGDVLLYIHSAGAKESRDLRASLQAVRHQLSGKS